MSTAAARTAGKESHVFDVLDYDPHEAFARDLLTFTVRSGAVNRWAEVHRYTVDCRPGQVGAEGVDVQTDVPWRVDLYDVMAAAKTFAAEVRGRVPAGVETDSDWGRAARVAAALDAIHAGLRRGIYPPRHDLTDVIDQRPRTGSSRSPP